ncbi:hypothetical protein [Corynebacterium sp.]|uniref:hypothetical protein n=1 Tax=Corynebacterium sp. TaxID=1720 RepID=UPI0026DB29C2|nr:hypothetical protein [Corynebacterium sp.]MDO5033056.1 hypothetical protein [Corynebacterium sp.]
MGLFSALSRLTGPSAPRLASPDAGAPVIELERLEVHTAGTLVIVVTDSPGAQVLREVARSGQAARLVSASASVFLSPTRRDELSVHDPATGWVIPLGPEQRERIARELPATGDLELSESLAFSVEG